MKKSIVFAVFLTLCVALLSGCSEEKTVSTKENNKGEASATVEASATIDKTSFPDDGFRAYVLEVCDTNGDGALSEKECMEVTSIEVGGMDIKDLTGIALFPSLTYLDCHMNLLTALDMSGNPALRALWCGYNQLASLNVSENAALTTLWCGRNELAELDVSGSAGLVSLSCPFNNLSEIDVSTLPLLSELCCAGNALSTLDVTHNPRLTRLECYYNQLTELDVAQNPSLDSLNCAYNLLTTLSTHGNPLLRHLYIAHNHNTLTGLDVSKSPLLYTVHLSDNYALSNIDLSSQTELVNIFNSALYQADRHFWINQNAPIAAMDEWETDEGYWDDDGNYRVTWVNEGKSQSAMVLSGEGLLLKASPYTADGVIAASNERGRYVELGYSGELRFNLETVCAASDITGLELWLQCFREGDGEITLTFQDAHIELAGGESIELASLNGERGVSMEQNTWDDVSYSYAAVNIELSEAMPAYDLHGAVLCVDVAVQELS